ncbi:MAG: hypothetical protein M1608_09860 [Candidatus Omnitrophica bacterium]|nr:hypothetical protein [Candidatus Omnitrophota bacterium]
MPSMPIKFKTSIIGTLVLAGVAASLAVQHHAQARLREQDEVFRQQKTQLAQAVAENRQLSNRIAHADGSLASDQYTQLLKLRGEVGMLRKETNELTQLRIENQQLRAALASTGANPQTPEVDPALERDQQIGHDKMDDAKRWCLALILYAKAHQDQFPSTIEEAPGCLPATDRLPGLSAGQFDLLFHGSLTNPDKTSKLQRQ